MAGSPSGLSQYAGKPAPANLLADIPALERAYFDRHPDPAEPTQRVSFGTSGHRGTSRLASFNEDHILATTQAICEYRRSRGIDGPLFMGKDTHALSRLAEVTALEVLAGNGVEVVTQEGDGWTPTPVISRAILCWNRDRRDRIGDGVVITPSHNPPEDGGFKYNPPNGGPADTGATRWIQDRANELLVGKLAGVRRVSVETARRAPTTRVSDFIAPYVDDLVSVVDIKAIRDARVRLGVDPMGGASVRYWEAIAARHRLDLTVVNQSVDPTFAFMTVDHDGKIRMDCSSPHAMASLIRLKDDYAVAFGNDPDSDRHGIVTPTAGLMNPNHYLAVAIDYLFRHRPRWPASAAIGKTLVSSAIIDRVARDLGRRLCEVPVGFKWFVDGLVDGSFGFGGEESAGASFLRMDGTVWSTDKDGIILNLLAAEMKAVTGKDPGESFRALATRHGMPRYARVDRAATPAQKARLGKLSPEDVRASSLAGSSIVDRLVNAPGNNAPIGGLKVVSENGWFAARPSGTEDIYKIYAESFVDESHLARVLDEATAIVHAALA